MPLLSCDPLVLVGAVGSIEGVRSQLLRRGCSSIVSETVGTLFLPPAAATAVSAPHPALRPAALTFVHRAQMPNTRSWQTTQQAESQSPRQQTHRAPKSSPSLHPTAHWSQVMQTPHAHSSRCHWKHLLKPQPTTGGRLRVIHSITKVRTDRSTSDQFYPAPQMQWAHSFFLRSTLTTPSRRWPHSFFPAFNPRNTLLTHTPFCKGRRL